MSNKGEENEILIKTFLARYFYKKQELLGAPEEIRIICSIGFGPGVEIPNWLESEYEDAFENQDYEKCKNMFSKAPASYKADISINGIRYSLKYKNAAKSAIINHTARDGFLNICEKINVDIARLDKMIAEYWDLRREGKITEDVSNNSILCPFRDNKEYLKPILEYFLFKGTGKRGDSAFPADKILSFGDPFDPSTYKILEPSEAVDSMWDNLTFSMRSKKGMPIKKVEGRVVDTYSAEAYPLLAPWVEYRPDDEFPKGALHVRN